MSPRNQCGSISHSVKKELMTDRRNFLISSVVSVLPYMIGTPHSFTQGSGLSQSFPMGVFSLSDVCRGFPGIQWGCFLLFLSHFWAFFLGFRCDICIFAAFILGFSEDYVCGLNWSFRWSAALCPSSMIFLCSSREISGTFAARARDDADGQGSALFPRTET
jgi:hypothetical protein